MSYLFWLTISALLIGFELFSLSFYLLAVSAGTTVAAIFSFFHFSLEIQIMSAAFTCIILVIFINKYRKANNISNKGNNFIIDKNEEVVVLLENIESLKINYRGSIWQAKFNCENPKPGLYYIENISSNIVYLSSEKVS